jgi:protein SCO1/2
MRRSISLLLVALVLALAAGAYLWRLGDQQIAMPQNVSTAEPAETTIGGPFSLVDQDGMRRSEQAFRGRFMLVFFGYI